MSLSVTCASCEFLSNDIVRQMQQPRFQPILLHDKDQQVLIVKCAPGGEVLLSTMFCVSIVQRKVYRVLRVSTVDVRSL